LRALSARYDYVFESWKYLEYGHGGHREDFYIFRIILSDLNLSFNVKYIKLHCTKLVLFLLPICWLCTQLC